MKKQLKQLLVLLVCLFALGTFFVVLASISVPTAKVFKEFSEPHVYLGELPVKILQIVIALITLGALWRQFLEALGFQFFLTNVYTRREDGATIEVRDLWESSESIRVLKLGLASQAGYRANKAESDYCVESSSKFEYRMVVMVDDLTLFSGKSVFPAIPGKEDKPKPSRVGDTEIVALLLQKSGLLEDSRDVEDIIKSLTKDIQGQKEEAKQKKAEEK